MQPKKKSGPKHYTFHLRRTTDGRYKVGLPDKGGMYHDITIPTGSFDLAERVAEAMYVDWHLFRFPVYLRVRRTRNATTHTATFLRPDKRVERWNMSSDLLASTQRAIAFVRLVHWDHASADFRNAKPPAGALPKPPKAEQHELPLDDAPAPKARAIETVEHPTVLEILEHRLQLLPEDIQVSGADGVWFNLRVMDGATIPLASKVRPRPIARVRAYDMAEAFAHIGRVFRFTQPGPKYILHGVNRDGLEIVDMAGKKVSGDPPITTATLGKCALWEDDGSPCGNVIS